MLSSKYADPAQLMGRSDVRSTSTTALLDPKASPPSLKQVDSPRNVHETAASDGRGEPETPTVQTQSKPPVKKKKITRHGKGCVICLPTDVERGKPGHPPRPLSPSEVRARLKSFEDAGYDTRGFTHSSSPNSQLNSDFEIQSRPVFPEPEIGRNFTDNINVRIPNRHEWEAYVNFLTEQKLRALGVSLGEEEVEVSKSRRNSSPFPVVPHGPSPLGSIGGSQRRGSVMSPALIPGSSVSNRGEPFAASPIPMLNNSRPGLHLHRPSSFTSPASIPLQYPTPPGLPNWSPQQYINPYGVARGGSPALPSSRSLPEGTTSPAGKPDVRLVQQFPFPPQDDLVNQIRQQQQQLQAQLLSQQQQQIFGVRPPSALEQVPEDEAENDPVADVRANAQPGPEILNPKPRGHRHNISANLERDVRGAEYHLDKDIDRQLNQDARLNESPSMSPRTTNNSVPLQIHDAQGQNGFIVQPQSRNRSPSLTQQPVSKYSDPSPGPRHDNPGGVADLDTHEVEPSARLDQAQVTPSTPKSHDASLNHSRSVSVVAVDTQPINGSKIQSLPLGHTSKGSITKLNVEAKEFKFNPNASFSLNNFATSGFTFQPTNSTRPVPPLRKFPSNGPEQPNAVATRLGHGLNISAPSFTPGNYQPSVVPKGDFNFSSKLPAFKPDAPAFQPGGTLNKPASNSNTSQNPSNGSTARIFSHVDFDIVKPVKSSKAIPIIPPSQSQQRPENEVKEDESGHITQGDGRQKRPRHVDADKDEVPQFATPVDEPAVAGHTPQAAIGQADTPGSSEDKEHMPIKEADDTAGVDEVSTQVPLEAVEKSQQGESLLSDVEKNGEALSEPNDEAHVDENGDDNVVSHSSAESVPTPTPSTSNSQHTLGLDTSTISSSTLLSSTQTSQAPLSATAKPFELVLPNMAPSSLGELNTNRSAQDEVPDGEGHLQSEDISLEALSGVPATSLRPEAREMLAAELEPRKQTPYPNGEVFDYDPFVPPFNEIDAVMKHLNEDGSDIGVERSGPAWVRSSPPAFPPKQLATELRPQTDVRSNAPSPSPRRMYSNPVKHTNSDDSEDAEQNPFSDGRAGRPYEALSRRTASGDVSLPHWDDEVSSTEEATEKLDDDLSSHSVGRLVDAVLKSRLAPLETRLQMVQESLAAVPLRSGSRRRRSFSGDVIDSDADDEDEEATSVFDLRNRSPRRDRRLEKLKTVVLEAIASQRLASGPQLSATDLADLRQAITELKSTPATNVHEDIDFAHLSQELAEVKASLAAVISGDGNMDRIKEVVQDSFKDHQQALMQSRDSSQQKESHARILELEDMLKEAVKRGDEAVEARNDAEKSEAKMIQLLKLAQEECTILRKSAQDDNDRLRSVEQEYREARMKIAASEAAQDVLRERVTSLAAEGDALNATLEEYRTSSTQWRAEVDQASREKDLLKKTIGALESQKQEGQHIRQIMRGKLEKLQSDLSAAVAQIATEKSVWQKTDTERSKSYEVLSARLEAEARTRERLERELERLEMQEKEAMRQRVVASQTQSANTRLEEMVNRLREDNLDLQRTVVRVQGELEEAREAGRSEVLRTRTLLEADVAAADRRCEILRASFEEQIARMRSEMEATKQEAEATRARYQFDLQQSADAKKAAVSEALQWKDSVLEEQRQRYEQQIEDIQARQFAALEIAAQERQSSEANLEERLKIANSEIRTLEDKLSHLGERLDIAKSAAQAAAAAAQSAKSPSRNVQQGPEKISPQALRESIVVLQEQLHEREGRIEQLEQKLSGVDADLPAKLKEREIEVGWLRELLGVRIDDLTDLVNALSNPAFDPEAVRDAAIRIRTNLQMEQQEKERMMTGSSSFPSLASISNFASPKAVQLAAAIGSWRKGRDTARAGSRTAAQPEAHTPSKLSPSAHSFLSGLMTPPASNLRRTPTPRASLASAASQPPSRAMSLSLGRGSSSSERPLQDMDAAPRTPQFLRKGSYDQDAEDGDLSSSGYYDEDRSTVGDTVAEASSNMFGPGLRP